MSSYDMNPCAILSKSLKGMPATNAQYTVHVHGFYVVSNTFCQEKHQHFHADRQLVTKKEISIKINFKNNV